MAYWYCVQCGKRLEVERGACRFCAPQHPANAAAVLPSPPPPPRMAPAPVRAAPAATAAKATQATRRFRLLWKGAAYGLLAAFIPRKQPLHDLLTGSVVLKRKA